jgi:hypothetical protein
MLRCCVQLALLGGGGGSGLRSRLPPGGGAPFVLYATPAVCTVGWIWMGQCLVRRYPAGANTDTINRAPRIIHFAYPARPRVSPTE